MFISPISEMGISQSLDQKRRGVIYDSTVPFGNQLKPVTTEPWRATPRLQPFIFHHVGFRISVQASWSTHCSFDDGGVKSSYPYWNGYYAAAAERGPFPLESALTFELAIERLEYDGSESELYGGLLSPQVLETSVSADIVQKLLPHWKGDDVGSEVGKEVVVTLLNELQVADCTENATVLKRTTERVQKFKEELMQHVWRPQNCSSFDALAAYNEE